MRRLADIALLPFIAPQALWVAARAARLPEAAGPRSGEVGQGAALRLLILGDSSAAGVGVEHQEQALAGNLSRLLAAHHRVSWQVQAVSGATVASTHRLLRASNAAPADIAVVALGVNDTKNGVPMSRWRAGYADLITTLQTDFGVRHVYVSGLPPLGEFPLLPQPLRGVLGRRAVRFDRALETLCAARDGVTYVPLDLQMDTSKMASDGFHPGAEVYAAWAALIARRMLGSQPLERT
ncbi:MAG: SGNH/GDSL hydrolase family protein [Pseudomonadota bacterium]